jgi:thiamine biosynthesis lipoprotein
MSMDIRDPGDHTALAGRAFDVLRQADATFSTYREESEVSAVNRGELALVDASADVHAVVAIGQALQLRSGGAFRIRNAEGALDLDGVVKGWAADRAAQVLKRDGVREFCLNAGGDVAVGRGPAGAATWNVGVRSPDDPAVMLAVLAVADTAVATSGAYERGPHIVDGRTGAPAGGLLSATVVAEDLTTADVLATAVFALGEPGVEWALGHGARGVLALSAEGVLSAAGELQFARPSA